MAKVYPFDVSTPAGSADPTQGDNRIRELKDAIHERMDLDHYWEKIGNIVDEDDAGYHRKVTLLVRTKPTAKANAGIFYSKDVGGKAEAFYLDEDDNEVQLTSAGAILGSPFVTGDWIQSSVGTAHSGWTEVTATYAGRYVRVGSTGLATGGSATHTHGAGSYSGSAHTHPIPHTHTVGVGDFSGSGYISRHDKFFTTSASSNASSGSSGTGSVTGTSAAGNNAPLYVDIRIFQKD